jgi:hypothetical protein
MVYNSSRRAAVCCSFELISLDVKSGRSGVPSRRTEEAMMRLVELRGWVIV